MEENEEQRVAAGSGGGLVATVLAASAPVARVRSTPRRKSAASAGCSSKSVRGEMAGARGGWRGGKWAGVEAIATMLEAVCHRAVQRGAEGGWSGAQGGGTSDWSVSEPIGTACGSSGRNTGSRGYPAITLGACKKNQFILWPLFI